METVKVRALGAFTRFVPGYGQVHGDPESSDEKARFPMVPAGEVSRLVDERKVDAPEGWDAPAAHDAAASSPGDSTVVLEDAFTFKPAGVGRWSITGPGLAEPEVFKGKKVEAQARVAELQAAHDDAADQDAPVS